MNIQTDQGRLNPDDLLTQILEDQEIPAEVSGISGAKKALLLKILGEKSNEFKSPEQIRSEKEKETLIDPFAFNPNSINITQNSTGIYIESFDLWSVEPESERPMVTSTLLTPRTRIVDPQEISTLLINQDQLNIAQKTQESFADREKMRTPLVKIFQFLKEQEVQLSPQEFETVKAFYNKGNYLAMFTILKTKLRDLEPNSEIEKTILIIEQAQNYVQTADSLNSINTQGVSKDILTTVESGFDIFIKVEGANQHPADIASYLEQWTYYLTKRKQKMHVFLADSSPSGNWSILFALKQVYPSTLHIYIDEQHTDQIAGHFTADHVAGFNKNRTMHSSVTYQFCLTNFILTHRLETTTNFPLTVTYEHLIEKGLLSTVQGTPGFKEVIKGSVDPSILVNQPEYHEF